MQLGGGFWVSSGYPPMLTPPPPRLCPLLCSWSRCTVRRTAWSYASFIGTPPGFSSASSNRLPVAVWRNSPCLVAASSR
jgi:hypothetical protein